MLVAPRSGVVTSFEDEARRAAERWLGVAARVERPLGVALLDVEGRALAVWFHALSVEASESPTEAALAAAERGGWETVWLAPERASLELQQREERLLVARVAAERARAGRGAELWSRLLPDSRSDRWVAGAAAAAVALALTAAARGWLEGPVALAVLVPRLALAAAVGGLCSATLRGRSPLVGAAVGSAAGSLLAAALAAGFVQGLALGPAGALAVAFLGAFAERRLVAPR